MVLNMGAGQYGISFCVLVDVPKTPKRIEKNLSSNKNAKSTDTFLCRCSMNELVLEHNSYCFEDMEHKCIVRCG
jgi:hypothetical protein